MQSLTYRWPQHHHHYSRLIATATLSLFIALSIAPKTGTSSSLVTCHGPLPGVQYRYRYQTDVHLNNADRREPAGFGLEATLAVENVWQDGTSTLLEVALERVQFKPRSDARPSGSFKEGPPISSWPLVLANIVGRTGQLQSLYVAKDKAGHASGHHLEPTHLNLVVALLNALRSRLGDQPSPGTSLTGRLLTRRSHSSEDDQLLSSSHADSTSSLLSPHVTDHWEIISNLAADHDFPEQVTGWQNVTIESKIFRQAHSHLSTTFTLQLENEKPSSGRPTVSGGSVADAVKSIGDGHFVPLAVHFIAEKKPCDPHYCGRLEDLVEAYSPLLAEQNNLASTSIGIAYLHLVDYFRVNSATVTRKEVGRLLKKLFKRRHQDGDVFITVLDAVAGSRHHEAMLAASAFLDLPQCGDASADTCERFLVAVALSAMTTANMGARSHIAEHSLGAEQLVELLLPLASSPKWADERVKHAYSLTLATLVHAFAVSVQTERANSSSSASDHLYSEALLAPHSNPIFVDVTEEDASGGRKLHAEKLGGGEVVHAHRVAKVAEKTIKYLVAQLEACKETDCRVVHLHALGNVRIFTRFGVLSILKRYALNAGAKRESVAAMKALRDCVHYSLGVTGERLSEKMTTRLRQLLLRALYDATLETTSRLIAAELLTRYVDEEDGRIARELLRHLDTFPVELATIIWKRAIVGVQRSQLVKGEAKVTDWRMHAKALSGSSASFQYVMGGTGHCNASYGVFLELLKGKLPKETNFNVEISSDGGNGGSVSVQDIVGVGLFARGLQSFAGGEDGAAEDDPSENEVPDGTAADADDSTLAGMTLTLLGNQLRPFLFFRSTSELMGHLWSGAASEPTPVFRSNLLLADYADIRPLVSGLLVEQSLKGVLSLDLTGEVQVSLWNRNSHSNVQTRASVLVQGSQQIFTTDRKTSARKMFSFGGASSLNFITDFDFYNSPYRICIQITQPEFVFKHNTRKYEQVHSDELHRRIHRRAYHIPAKSYVLNHDNSKMCALMNADAD